MTDEIEFQISKLDSELIKIQQKIEAGLMDQKTEFELEDLYTQSQIIEIELATEREKLNELMKVRTQKSINVNSEQRHVKMEGIRIYNETSDESDESDE
jgi:hypothetical protein